MVVGRMPTALKIRFMNKDVAMNSSRRKFAAILDALGVPPSARRQAPTPALPACESLEGRQLLTGGMGLPGMGMGMGMGVADVAGLGTGVFHGAANAIAPGSTNTQLQADLTKLNADTQTIQDQSVVTPAMTSTVTADVKAIKSAETTPASPASLTNLQTALQAANTTSGGPTLQQAFQLEIDQNIVYLSQGVPTGLIDKLDADQFAVMNATGITAAQEATLAADHAAVTADQKAVPTPTTGTTTTAVPVTGTMPTGTMAPVAGMLGQGVGSPAATGSMGELAAAGASVLVPSMADGGRMAPMMMGGGGLLDLGVMAPSTTSTTPAEATLKADMTTLKADSQTLQSEMQTVQATSNVTPAMEAIVKADLAAVRGAASAPASSAALATLKSDYTTALTNSGGPTASQTTQVQTDQAAVYGSEGVGTTLIAKLQAAQAAVTAASGITAAEEGALYADQQTVQNDQAKVKADVEALPPTTTTTTTTTPATLASAFPQPNGNGFGQGGFLPGV